ncbi:MAG: hypothetical protein LBQ22_07830 [Bacteroidales bacterium]|nr:hypothetical protein [Bacteroidales bacterium]
MRIASIDIGTNTCNLSIAEYISGEELKFIYKEKEVIALINSEFQDDKISQNSINNLINVLKKYKRITEEFGVEKIIATATSGIRSSENKYHIIEKINEIVKVEVTIIDGYSEANYVYEGVKNAVTFGIDYVLIIDIGGGSIEFVICNMYGINTVYSFNIGAARLLHHNKFSDPLNFGDINNLEVTLKETLKDLLKLCKELKVNTLIGSSGSFETFVNLINKEKKQQTEKNTKRYNIIDIEKFDIICKKLITYNYDQRYNMPGIDVVRIKLIPLAAFITHFLISNLKINNLIQSRYSIKEGLIFDYISKNFKN